LPAQIGIGFELNGKGIGVHHLAMGKPKKPTAKAAGAKNSSTKNLNDAVWLTSDAKKVMAQCFIDGILPLDSELDSKDIYDSLFSNHASFADFPYDKELYDGRLTRLRDGVKARQDWAAYDAAALMKDRKKHPERMFNSKGEPNWRGSEADTWLKIDMQAEKHLTMKPGKLWASRPCYKVFTKERFSKRIDQMKQREKEFDKTPGQAKSNSKKLGDPSKSLLLG